MGRQPTDGEIPDIRVNGVIVTPHFLHERTVPLKAGGAVPGLPGGDGGVEHVNQGAAVFRRAQTVPPIPGGGGGSGRSNRCRGSG